MADEILLNQPTRGRDQILRGLLAAYWFPFSLSIALMLGCYTAAGETLGLLLGGIVVATIVTPGAVMTEQSCVGRLAACAAVVDAALLVWLAPVVSGAISFGDWLEAVLVLLAYSAAVGGVACALERIRVPAVLAAALTVLLGLAWLSWPVWMAPWLTGENREEVVAWLVWGHPLFALNGATLEAFGQPWAQMTIAYRLTNIGDDVGYEMPQTVWACVGMHVVIAIIVTAPQFLFARRRNNRFAHADPATTPA